jgi:LemA protein
VTAEQLAVLALAAVLVFWMVGAYNRLVSLRNAIAAAWGGIAAVVQQRADAIAPVLQALREPLVAEHSALDALHASHAQAQTAAAEMAAHPLNLAAVTGWRSAEAALASAASRVLALLDQHTQLRGAPAVSGAVAAWQQADARLAYSCQVFDTAVLAYNEAIAQLPTRWLLRSFGFGPAGRLKG